MLGLTFNRAGGNTIAGGGRRGRGRVAVRRCRRSHEVGSIRRLKTEENQIKNSLLADLLALRAYVTPSFDQRRRRFIGHGHFPPRRLNFSHSRLNGGVAYVACGGNYKQIRLHSLSIYPLASRRDTT